MTILYKLRLIVLGKALDRSYFFERRSCSVCTIHQQEERVSSADYGISSPRDGSPRYPRQSPFANSTAGRSAASKGTGIPASIACVIGPSLKSTEQKVRMVGMMHDGGATIGPMFTGRQRQGRDGRSRARSTRMRATPTKSGSSAESVGQLRVFLGSKALTLKKETGGGAQSRSARITSAGVSRLVSPRGTGTGRALGVEHPARSLRRCS